MKVIVTYFREKFTNRLTVHFLCVTTEGNIKQLNILIYKIMIKIVKYLTGNYSKRVKTPERDENYLVFKRFM